MKSKTDTTSGEKIQFEFSSLKKYFYVFLFSCSLLPDETGASIEKPMATLVYIHGESYEWNSGNLYDGTVLAAHSSIIVVTINFRLGVLGELNPRYFLYLSAYIFLVGWDETGRL